MSILIGVSWLFYWALIDIFNINDLKAALVTAVVFIIVGLLYDYRPWVRKP